MGENIGEEISNALHRALSVEVSEEVAATKTRLSFARDLHDSVIQLLAGANFRLEAIKRSALAGKNISPAVEALQSELVAEQRDLRGFIKQLRDGDARRGSANLCDTLRTVLERMTRQWMVECELLRCPETLKLTPKFEHDIQQLVREGIANAVKHGEATHVSISVDTGETGVSLIIADNGRGFYSGAEAVNKPIKPWSLNSRVHELGGTLSLYSSATGARIIISLPFGAEE
jgi:signal transduction histidine kinase